MSDIYVYYRVRSELAALMLPHVRTMQERLHEIYGVEPLLKRRPEEKDGAQTWLEIYPSVPDDFLGALEQAAIDAHLPIDGGRHIEIFVDLPQCA
ncbi:MAG: DUF4936 family protein [Betaproteobacteria bacterium]